MSRVGVSVLIELHHVPRASGDEPLEYLGMLVDRICSPRERG